MKMMHLLMIVFLVTEVSAQTRVKQASALPFTLSQDLNEGSVFFNFKPYQAEGRDILCKAELFSGTSSANAAVISSAVNEKTFKKVSGVYDYFPIRIPHPYLLSAKLSGTLANAPSLMGKLTLRVAGATDKVLWAGPFKYSFANRDSNTRFKALHVNTAASCELYQIDNKSRYLFAADVNAGAKLQILLGQPAVPPMATTKGMNSFWDDAIGKNINTVALVNTSFFTDASAYLGWEVNSGFAHGTKTGNVWWSGFEPHRTMRALVINTWTADVIEKSTKNLANDKLNAAETKRLIEKIPGSEIIVGFSTELTSSQVTGRVILGTSSNGGMVYILCADNALAPMTLADATKAIVDGGADKSKTIWLDGSGSARMRVKFGSEQQTLVPGDRRTVNAMLSIGQK